MKWTVFITVVFLAQVACAQEKVADSLRNYLVTTPQDSSHMKALLGLAAEYSRRDLSKTKSYCRQALALAKKLHTTYLVSGIYSYLITSHQNLGEIDSAQNQLENFKKLTLANPSDKNNFNYLTTAGLFYKNKGSYKEASIYLMESIKFIEKTDNIGLAGQLINIGNVYTSLGQYNKAVETHLKSLELFEKVGNKRGQSFCLQSLGNSFNELGQFKEAKKYYTRSLELKTELADSRGMINVWGGLASVCAHLQQYSEAISLYQQMVKGSKDLNLVRDEMSAYFEMGKVYITMKEIEFAKKYLSKSLTIAEQTGDSPMITLIQVELNSLKTKNESEKSELPLLLKSLENSKTVGDRPLEAKNYSLLSSYYKKRKNSDSALYYLELFHQVNDSIVGKDLKVQIMTIEQQYNQNKNEKEIALLKKEQEINHLALVRQQTMQGGIIIVSFLIIVITMLLVNRYRIQNKAKRQAEIENMRNSLARDLHDDIGSTLSTINIISKIAMRENPQGNNQHLARISEQSSQMMESMADMVWSINPINDSIEKIVVKMKVFAGEILEPKNINYQFDEENSLSGITLNVEKRKNLFLLYKEAINNAAKYSEASQVNIVFKKIENRIILTITDNGIGFMEDQVAQGNGLRNMKSRAESLGAQFELISAPNEGTRIAVSFPIT